MSAREFNDWIALYNIEDRERERAKQDAADKAKAQRLARGMRAVR